LLIAYSLYTYAYIRLTAEHALFAAAAAAGGADSNAV